MKRRGAVGMTFSCAACHASNLFGKTVLGLTNRFPRSNDIFFQAKKGLSSADPSVFQFTSGATDAETDLIRQAKRNVKFIGIKQPVALGLDTSLAQVALSLNHRNPDGDATRGKYFAENPRPDDFHDRFPADSKPAVWWNLKYKNRWLSDGSVIAGNPILTNFLWNEIGRGADLKKLSRWYETNQKTIRDLTAAVFASEAPRYTDFFPPESIDLAQAKRGESLYIQHCAGCHGTYEKAWSLPHADQLSHRAKLETVTVRYPEKTKVIDVGTDPYRRLGMKSLEKLNQLNISKKYGIIVRAQHGYVPPPLVGIWARWPYFHNNSIPNLCALLTSSDLRPQKYYSGAAIDPNTDFDSTCNGYPSAAKTPKAWKTEEHLYDTEKLGMGNMGHDKDIFIDENNQEVMTSKEKLDLIKFLQTL
jgi:hypothetical protein